MERIRTKLLAFFFGILLGTIGTPFIVGWYRYILHQPDAQIIQSEPVQHQLKIAFMQGMIMQSTYEFCKRHHGIDMPYLPSMQHFFQARHEFPGEQPPCHIIQAILAREKP